MDTRSLGGSVAVSALGLGCMPMSSEGAVHYGAADEAEAVATIHRAIDLGITLFDTAEAYGGNENERLLGRTIKGRRDGLIIATKFGVGLDGSLNSSPEAVRKACEGSLGRLGIERIDLYYQHRVDPAVPIEETVGAVAMLIAEGKVGAIGLSEASAATLTRAVAVHPIAALQSEYSLWERGVEDEILLTARALGIGFVPYSPLGRGFLAGAVPPVAEMDAQDYRRLDPRFSEENAGRNLGIVAALRDIAAGHDASAAQVALAWLLAQGSDIVPIPGCKRRVTLEDSAKAAGLRLSAEDLARLDDVAPRGGTAGARYGSYFMKSIDR